MSQSKEGSGLNNSMSEQKIEQVLQKIKQGTGGTVSYVFISERVVFTKDKPDGETIQVKSFLHSNINPQVFFKLEGNKTVRRSMAEVIEVFETTMIDLGAREFIID